MKPARAQQDSSREVIPQETAPRLCDPCVHGSSDSNKGPNQQLTVVHDVVDLLGDLIVAQGRQVGEGLEVLVVQGGPHLMDRVRRVSSCSRLHSADTGAGGRQGVSMQNGRRTCANHALYTRTRPHNRRRPDQCTRAQARSVITGNRMLGCATGARLAKRAGRGLATQPQLRKSQAAALHQRRAGQGRTIMAFVEAPLLTVRAWKLALRAAGRCRDARVTRGACTGTTFMDIAVCMAAGCVGSGGRATEQGCSCSCCVGGCKDGRE